MWERLYLSAQQQLSSGNHAVAESYFQQAILEGEKEFGEWDNRLAIVLNSYATCLRVQGKMAESEANYKRALTIRRKALGPMHQEEVIILENYARLLRVMGRDQEAAKLENTAMGIIRMTL